MTSTIPGYQPDPGPTLLPDPHQQGLPGQDPTGQDQYLPQAGGDGHPTGDPGSPRGRQNSAGSRLLAAPDPAPATAAVIGSALTILAALLLTFLADLAVVGPVKHDRDQRVAFAQLRSELANATAMVNQVDENGKPYDLGTPLAVLSIPQIGLREVVFEGTTSGVLLSGPGHLRNSVLPGQTGVSVVFGRRTAFGGPFAYLDQLKAGDVVRVATGQGNDIAYRVVAVRRAGDPVPPAAPAGGGRLTLVTASGGAYQPDGLLLVDADLVGTPKPSAALDATALPSPERALQGDPGAWVLLVLWGQLLVVACLAVVYARTRWGRWQSWVAGLPVLVAVGLAASDQVVLLLPNLL